MQQELINWILLKKKKKDLANVKSDVDKSVADKLKNVLTNLRNFKTKVDELDVDKLVPIPVGLSKLSEVVKNDVKKTEYNELDKKFNDNSTTDTIYLVKKTDYSTKIT